MSIWTLMIREIAYRKLNFVLALVGVSAAVGLLVGVLTCLHLHDARSDKIVTRKQAETKATMAALKSDVKRAMHRLGYNAIILPKDQSLSDWYTQDYASQTMPESWASRLANTKDLVDRFLPRLRQRLMWDERQWTIIVVGVGGEQILDTSVCEATKLEETIPRGSCVVGYELHDALGLRPEEEIAINGRVFRSISKCDEELGTKDDITVWLNLADAQELVGKPNLINEITLVEHLSVWGNLKGVRRQLADVLPDCQVVEIASETLARAHARIKVAEEAKAALAREREKRALLRGKENAVLLLAPLGILGCAAWVGLLTYHNVRDRALEIGSLMAIGFRVGRVRTLVMSKAVLLGMAGGFVGFAGGAGVALLLGMDGRVSVGAGIGLEAVLGYFVFAQLVGIAACLLGCWFPAQAAVAMDPAEVLREE